jgi:hypothetical protein
MAPSDKQDSSDKEEEHNFTQPNQVDLTVDDLDFKNVEGSTTGKRTTKMLWWFFRDMRAKQKDGLLFWMVLFCKLQVTMVNVKLYFYYVCT